jgi:hypothetical protein
VFLLNYSGPAKTSTTGETRRSCFFYIHKPDYEKISENRKVVVAFKLQNAVFQPEVFALKAGNKTADMALKKCSIEANGRKDSAG